jgi:hypothetical protein
MDKKANSRQDNLEDQKRNQAVKLLESWMKKLKEKNSNYDKK